MAGGLSSSEGRGSGSDGLKFRVALGRSKLDWLMELAIGLGILMGLGIIFYWPGVRGLGCGWLTPPRRLNMCSATSVDCRPAEVMLPLRTCE